MKIRAVTVLGANGVMGTNISAIFASFGHAKVYMVSRNIEKSKQAVIKACQSVRADSIKENLIPADYEMLEKCILESDLVFESLVENWKIKYDAAKSISEIAKKNLEQCKEKIFCTGTSGLSVTKLCEIYPQQLRGNFIGFHMFNPPYAMPLCEMITTIYTNRKIFDSILSYCKDTLDRTVVEVKDVPAFLGNRIGFQFINLALQYAEKYKDNGGIDYIDSILGPFTGRSMAPIITSNFVGIDVHKAIVDNLYENTKDCMHYTFALPVFAQKLILEGKTGRKSGCGFYKTILHDSGIRIHQVFDIKFGIYRNIMHYEYPFVEGMIKNLKEGDYKNAFYILKNTRSLEAEICCKFLLLYILYALSTVKNIGTDIHTADDVMAMGFNWCPPLAMIEALGGVDEFISLCMERIDHALLKKFNVELLVENIRPSKYDFRKFIRAKR